MPNRRRVPLHAVLRGPEPPLVQVIGDPTDAARLLHVVLQVDEWKPIGKRGGLGGLADSFRRRLSRAIAPGLTGERRAVIEGVVLGDDEALTDDLRQDFRASGLYHLLSR